MIQEIQVQGKICTQRLVYTHMHASVVVVKDTNLTDGWSNDTLKESAVALRDTPTFATQNKELSFWWVWTNHTHTHIDTWVHVRLNSSKKIIKQGPKNGGSVASPNQKKHGVGSKNQKDHHATKQVKYIAFPERAKTIVSMVLTEWLLQFPPEC